MTDGWQPQPSPWAPEFQDYLGRRLIITVNFNEATRALTNAVVHRDTGCLYTKIVFDNPGDNVKAKRLAAPADGAGDLTYTANQLGKVGFDTIEQAMGVQITAEP